MITAAHTARAAAPAPPPAAPPPAPAAPDPHEAFLATRTFGSLDGLRALSILAVLWHHTDRGVDGSIVGARGFLGVDLFFVISGFLIVTLLLRERRRTGDLSLRGFYIRRFLRIFPPYYLMLAICAATALLKPGHGSAAILGDLPIALLYVSNLFPMHSLLSITWSLSTEEQFYLVVPALEKRLPRLLPWLLPVAWVLASLPPFGIWPELALPTFFRQTTYGPILLGVMLAHLLDRRGVFLAVHRVLGHPLSPLATGAVLVAALAQSAPDISGWPRLLIHLAMGLFLVSCVVRERHVLVPVLTLWPMRRIGVTSYGIYLYHMLAWYFVNGAMVRLGWTSQPLFFVANTLASWAVAEASFRLFESRVLALKGRFRA